MTHLVMPMGGKGSRFNKEGFEVPKPLIEINGKPLFYWATRSITKFLEVDLTFVVLREHIENFNIDKKIKEYFPAAKIEVINEVLNGAVLTCLEGVKNITDDEPIIFNDCDHMFTCEDFYEYCLNEKKYDGILLSFVSRDPKFSYLLLEDDLVKMTKEKEVISEHAICGVYYFKNKNIFVESTKEYLENCNYSEYFVSGVYNIMARNNLNIGYFDVDMHVSFGTPTEYEEALKCDQFRKLK